MRRRSQRGGWTGSQAAPSHKGIRLKESTAGKAASRSRKGGSLGSLATPPLGQTPVLLGSEICVPPPWQRELNAQEKRRPRRVATRCPTLVLPGRKTPDCHEVNGPQPGTCREQTTGVSSHHVYSTFSTMAISCRVRRPFTVRSLDHYLNRSVSPQTWTRIPVVSGEKRTNRHLARPRSGENHILGTLKRYSS